MKKTQDHSAPNSRDGLIISQACDAAFRGAVFSVTFLDRLLLLRTDVCYTLMVVVFETDARAVLFHRIRLICVIYQLPHLSCRRFRADHPRNPRAEDSPAVIFSSYLFSYT